MAPVPSKPIVWPLPEPTAPAAPPATPTTFGAQPVKPAPARAALMAAAPVRKLRRLIPDLSMLFLPLACARLLFCCGGDAVWRGGSQPLRSRRATCAPAKTRGLAGRFEQTPYARSTLRGRIIGSVNYGRNGHKRCIVKRTLYFSDVSSTCLPHDFVLKRRFGNSARADQLLEEPCNPDGDALADKAY